MDLSSIDQKLSGILLKLNNFDPASASSLESWLAIGLGVAVFFLVGIIALYVRKATDIKTISHHLKALKKQQRELSKSTRAGEIDAISEKMNTVVKQLEITTTTAEQIKNEIEHNHWRKKEIELIRREKLEEYMRNMFLAGEAMNIMFSNRLENKIEEYVNKRKG